MSLCMPIYDVLLSSRATSKPSIMHVHRIVMLCSHPLALWRGVFPSLLFLSREKLIARRSSSRTARSNEFLIQSRASKNYNLQKNRMSSANGSRCSRWKVVPLINLFLDVSFDFLCVRRNHKHVAQDFQPHCIPLLARSNLLPLTFGASIPPLYTGSQMMTMLGFLPSSLSSP